MSIHTVITSAAAAATYVGSMLCRGAREAIRKRMAICMRTYICMYVGNIRI